MCNRLLAAVWSNCDKRLKGIPKNILVRMAYYAAPDGTNIFPTIPTLAKEVGWDNRSIIRGIKSLEDMGYISKQSRKLNNTNHYILNVSLIFLFSEAENLENNPVDNSVDKYPISVDNPVSNLCNLIFNSDCESRL